MDSLKMHSKDITEDNIEKIAALFPNCITEATDEQGRLRKKIDFDLLRQELSREIVEGPQERYQLNWPGKRQALLTANAPIAKTLRPCLEESVDFDKTQNLFIEGDNLDALKLLQETYLGKVKMIYIDPPYNTGKNFIYSDNFFESVDEYLFDSQQVDGNGNQLVANIEVYGRFHSDWLTMMYSRLKLAKNLLTNDGIIFISIDDNEVHNLRKLCDEIFGEDNFMVNFSWRTDGNFDNQAKFKKCHEYILGYAKNEKFFSSPPVIDPNVPQNSKLYKSEVRNTIVKNGPKNPLSTIKLPIGFPSDLKEGKIAKRNDIWPHYISDAVIENGKLINEIEVESGWSSKELLLSFISNDCQPIQDNKGQETRFVISLTGAIEVIKQRSSEQSHVVSSLQNFGGPQKATNEIKLLGVNFDDYPKPLSLMTYLCQMVRGENDIYLDFFAGSSTTAHAIMKLNAEDNANRKFIMVQLPEACDKKSEAYKDGFKTIADIGKERIRRAGKKIKEENADKGFENLDTGFRVLKVDSSNVTDVYYTTGTISQDLLTQYTDNIKPDRNPEDLLFQVLLDWGVDLTLPITKKNIQGYKVFFVDEDALIACFDNEGKITEEFVKELTQYNPLRVVFRDAGFASDSVKINVTQIFKQLSPHTEVKTI
ncbi:TPA: site-specific DNA-methyltransferase [Legionella pneumophila]|nr:site-specific DNA-methyltransferase [Legionella pneumophila]HAT3987030.1 site-specific DNA-methyltransferase [Legionella pneumophila]HAT8879782.1 site-specific DNA-methyltransferase [Legionella pneumophila subsp. pneumophila]HAU0185249.1 site-specific DNA-methyltransferase [Legionella pneumophila]HAU1508266.1 site-specific DNA-methyltransferase [Legionella pneumophila]